MDGQGLNQLINSGKSKELSGEYSCTHVESMSHGMQKAKTVAKRVPGLGFLQLPQTGAAYHNMTCTPDDMLAMLDKGTITRCLRARARLVDLLVVVQRH